MDQMFIVVLSEKVNERTYSLTLPIGAPWAEAIDVAKFFSESVVKMAQDAEKQAQERAENPEVVEAIAEPVSEEV